jgi:hypothetical protein
MHLTKGRIDTHSATNMMRQDNASAEFLFTAIELLEVRSGSGDERVGIVGASATTPVITHAGLGENVFALEASNGVLSSLAEPIDLINEAPANFLRIHAEPQADGIFAALSADGFMGLGLADELHGQGWSASKLLPVAGAVRPDDLESHGGTTTRHFEPADDVLHPWPTPGGDRIS